MITVSKLLRIPEPLAKALKKGAHRKECSQHQVVLDAIASYLDTLNDPSITTLVGEHYADEAARQAQNEDNPES
jgi:hypothetical protein